MEKRTDYIDIAKGFAIIAVVLSHIGFETYNPAGLIPFKTIFAGGMWHVPVFFILAGFFVKEDKLTNTMSFIKGKLKSIHLFTLYFYIPAVLLHNQFLSIGFYSPSISYNGKHMANYEFLDFAKNIVAAIFFAGREPIVGPLWFAYVLSLAFIGYAILTKMCKQIFKNHNYEKIRFLICLCISVISAILSNKLNLTINRFSNTIVTMLLLSIGQYLFQKRKMSFDSWLVFGIAILLAYQNAVLNGNVYFNENRYRDLFHLICGSVSVLYIICFISKKIENTKIGYLIKIVGKKSFYIMALHLISFKIFAVLTNLFGYKISLDFFTPSVGSNIFLIVGFAIFGITIPIFLATVVEKIKKLIIQ